MTAKLNTQPYEARHGRAPSARDRDPHFWRFEFKVGGAEHAIERDGPFKEVRDRVLSAVGATFGPDTEVRLVR